MHRKYTGSVSSCSRAGSRRCGTGCTADKDGEMVVVHDEEIDRVSDGSGFVKDYTLAELKILNFNKTHPEYQDVKIPTLREVYEALKPTGMTINVELKTGIFWYKDLEKRYSS